MLVSNELPFKLLKNKGYLINTADSQGLKCPKLLREEMQLGVRVCKLTQGSRIEGSPHRAADPTGMHRLLPQRLVLAQLSWHLPGPSPWLGARNPERGVTVSGDTFQTASPHCRDC